MPTYAYRCADCGHAFDIQQSFSDDALTVCPECSGTLRKQFSAVGVVFKGSGFYRTDSRSGKSSATSSGSTSSTSTTSGSTASGSSTGAGTASSSSSSTASGSSAGAGTASGSSGSSGSKAASA